MCVKTSIRRIHNLSPKFSLGWAGLQMFGVDCAEHALLKTGCHWHREAFLAVHRKRNALIAEAYKRKRVYSKGKPPIVPTEAQTSSAQVTAIRAAVAVCNYRIDAVFLAYELARRSLLISGLSEEEADSWFERKLSFIFLYLKETKTITGIYS